MRLALVLWVVLWAYVATPWRSFQPRPSLENVQLVPFADGSVRGNVLNALAFVPLGVIGSSLGWSAGIVALTGASASGMTETLQLFSTRRYPSATDFLLNTTGTLIGIMLAGGWRTTTTEVARRPDESH
jgi:VanZ family protein